MNRRRVVAASLAAAVLASGEAGAQFLDPYDVPAAAVIRGENVWLRVDPAAQTAIVTYLQRGDEVTLTDAAVRADGVVFVPVETATGESGWVRDLFINPRSIGPARAPERPNERPAAEETPPAAEEGAAEDRQSRRQRRQNREAAGETNAAEEPPAAPAPEEAAEPAAPAPASEPEATGVGTSPDNPAPVGEALRATGVSVITRGRFLDRVGPTEPQNGYKFFEISTRIVNIGSGNQTFGPESFRVQDATSGAEFESVAVPVDDALAEATIAPQESLAGRIFFEVEEATSGLIITFDPDPSSPDDLYWAAL